jgi:NAD-dependent deacetylase
MPDTNNTIPMPAHTIASALLQARRIVVFTGAGMSADSGISTFRNSPDSYWSRFDPLELASAKAWRANRRRVWAWYEARRANVLASQPNAGHLAIARLADVLCRNANPEVQVDVITQNVDDLHERAGSHSVVHLHGSLFAPRCAACHRPGTFATGIPDLNAIEADSPRCKHCSGYIRPGVVWFGEAMPQDKFRLAEELVDACDAMLVVGTSGVVYPAAQLPIHAHLLGKFIAEINPEPSEIARYMRVQWPVSAAQGLPQLIELLNTA